MTDDPKPESDTLSTDPITDDAASAPPATPEETRPARQIRIGSQRQATGPIPEAEDAAEAPPDAEAESAAPPTEDPPSHRRFLPRACNRSRKICSERSTKRWRMCQLDDLLQARPRSEASARDG